MITFLVLCQYDQVITALVGFSLFQIHRAARHIHFTTDDGFEEFVFRFYYPGFASGNLRFFIFTFYRTGFDSCYPLLQVFDFTFRAAILFIDIVRKFLDTEHISMIGHSNTLHSILHCFIDQTSDACLTIQERILGMDM